MLLRSRFETGGSRSALIGPIVLVVAIAAVHVANVAQAQTNRGGQEHPNEPTWGPPVFGLRSPTVRDGKGGLPTLATIGGNATQDTNVAGVDCPPADPFEDNDTSDTPANLGTLAGFSQNNLTIESDSDADWYRFEVCEGGRWLVGFAAPGGFPGAVSISLFRNPGLILVGNVGGGSGGSIAGELVPDTEYLVLVNATDCSIYRLDILAIPTECGSTLERDNDPGECSAVVDYDLLSEDCGFTCNIPSGSTFPLGTTAVACTGNDPTQCERHTITQSLSDVVVDDNSISCNTGGFHVDSSYWRSFDLPALGLNEDYLIDSVDIGIDLAFSQTGVQPIFLRLYTNSGGSFPAGTLTEIGNAAFAVPNQEGTTVRLPVTAVAPAGSQLVVEIFTPAGAGNAFFIGTNPFGQTGPSFVTAAACGAPTPTPFSQIGFPGVQFVMYVNGCQARECEFSVTVSDVEPPRILCSRDQVVRCTSPEGASLDDVILQVAALDNCGEVAVTGDAPTDFFRATCQGGGPTIVTFTATDAVGLQTQCTTNVEVTGTLCCPAVSDAELALLPALLDVRQDHDGPTLTKANFDIWNQNEVRFSGTERCVNCWDQEWLSLHGAPNHFLMRNLHTDKGRARIDGIASSTVCDSTELQSVPAPLLGVLVKEITFDNRAPLTVRSATTLPGEGRQAGLIQFDRSGALTTPIEPPFAELSPGTPEAGQPGFAEPSERWHQGVGHPEPKGSGEDAHAGGGLPTGVVVGDAPNVDELENQTVVAGIGGPESDASTSEKGSVVIFPSVEVKWDARGNVIQNTFVELSNDNAAPVRVQLYFVQGDPPRGPLFAGDPPIQIDRAHEGWNWVDAQIQLTANQPTYWSVLTGQPLGVQPWTILDPGTSRGADGRPDPDPRNRGGRMIRGFILAWAINSSGDEISWNHLSGSATVIHYLNASAWDYKPWAFQCLSTAAAGARCNATAGGINLDGIEYDAAPDKLLMDFYSVGSEALSHPDVGPFAPR